jgi:hypothetical protein
MVEYNTLAAQVRAMAKAAIPLAQEADRVQLRPQSLIELHKREIAILERIAPLLTCDDGITKNHSLGDAAHDPPAVLQGEQQALDECTKWESEKKPKIAAAATPNYAGGQSGSCSDITGLGGGTGQSNCTPSNGVPPNIQKQIAQAQSAMQAAKSLKARNPSTAAAQFRKAAALFKAAGDVAQAAAAAEQAQTLEASADQPAPTASNNCLLPPVSHDLAGLITSCRNNAHEWVTYVKSNHKRGCDKYGIDFTYRDPESGTIKSADTTLSPIQTCGGPATDIRQK